MRAIADLEPTAVFRYDLAASSGYRANGSAKISPDTYGRVMAIINGKTDPVITDLVAVLQEIADHYLTSPTSVHGQELISKAIAKATGKS